MLYESDVSHLLTQWKALANSKKEDQSYRDALNDCCYDLQSLIDKTSLEESLEHEAFEQQLHRDWKYWEDYFNAFLNNEGLM